MRFGILTTALALRTARKRSEERRPAPTMWEKANTERYYTPLRVRLRNILNAVDAWWDRHPRIVLFLAVNVIAAGFLAAVNLELGRPWF